MLFLLFIFHVNREEVERMAKEFNMRLYRTSVKEDLNVDDVFQHLAENYVNKVKSFNDFEANIGYSNNSHELPLHQGGISHSMGLNVYGTSSSARQLIQIGASSSSITRPYSHNTQQQRIISVGAPRTNGYYKRNNNNTGYRPNNGYTGGGIGGYNNDYSNQTYSSRSEQSTGHHIIGNR